jgi:hypothetical protein
MSPCGVAWLYDHERDYSSIRIRHAARRTIVQDRQIQREPRVSSLRESRQSLGVLIETHGIKADGITRAALYLTSNQIGFRGLMKEVVAREAIGLSSEFLSKPELLTRFGIERTSTITSQGSVGLDPAKACRLPRGNYSCQS